MKIARAQSAQPPVIEHFLRITRGAWGPRRVFDAISWRLLKLAPLYRSLLAQNVVFIAITGSCGKTTTKELAAAVLATKLSGRMNPASFNVPPHLDRTVVRARPWHDYCLLEVAPTKDGKVIFDRVLRLVRPQIGVVTVIGTDHIRAFRTIEAIAAEKAKLIAALPDSGTAVLNFDDPRVRAMQSLCAGRILSYGTTDDAMLRAEDVRSAWPDRLSFTLRYGGQSVPVATQLYGAHLVSSALAAVGIGLAMGVPLQAAAKALASVAPFRRRMGEIRHPDGFTIIRDDYKAPFWSIPASLQFMKDARAPRKAVVIGTISDTIGSPGTAYVAIARQALAVADLVLFVGRNSSRCLKAKRHPGDDALGAFYAPEAAARYLRAWLKSGDLVLVKGSEVDRFDALIDDIERPPTAARAVFAEPTKPAGMQVVVGLGNPEERHRETPHNAGHRALDLLAVSLGAAWKLEANAMIARAKHGESDVCLIKNLSAMNTTGPILLELARRVGFGPGDCILVHDDIDLPVGSVRVRMRASDAGHRGVRSVLETFQTDEVRRVRIGVGRPGHDKNIRDYVLSPLSQTELAMVDDACAEAVSRINELLGKRQAALPSASTPPKLMQVS